MARIIHEPIVDNSKKISNTVISLIIVTIGSIFIGITTSALINPSKLYAGGVTGISQIILQIGGLIFCDGKWDALNKYLSIVNFLMLMPFNILAFLKLSKKYAFYTFWSSIVQTIVMLFSDFWISLNIFSTTERLTCVVIAAVINGFSNGLMMKRGGTSGGIITLCQFLNLKKGKSVGSINLIISSMIVLVGASISFVTTDQTGASAIGAGLSTALYTLLFFILDSLVIDHIHTSYNKVKIECVTEKGEYIADELLKEFKRGLTLTKAVGAYTKREKTILTIVTQDAEMSEYIKRLKELDEDCFITIIPVMRFSGIFNVHVIDK